MCFAKKLIFIVHNNKSNKRITFNVIFSTPAFEKDFLEC